MNQFEQGNKVERVEKSQEKQAEASEKKMAARERVEVVSREVKSAKQQIQNIMGNMQMVVKAVQAIRAQLQLNQNGAIPSVARDSKNLEELKKKLAGLFGELQDLRGALLIEERKAILEEDKYLAAPEADRLAAERVEEIWRSLELDNEKAL